jgi:hypothetical protein
MEKTYDPAFVIGYNDWLDPVPRNLSRALQGLFGPTDLYALGTADEPHCYYARYYFQRDLGCELLPQYPAQPVEELTSHLRAVLAEHAVLWLQTYYNPAWDPGHVADLALSHSALDLGHEMVAERDLRLFTSAGTVLREQQPVAAEYGGVARLEGAWLRPGQTALHVVLVWRALADQPAVEAKVFVHLADETGFTLSQDDSIPVVWTRPLNTWAAGEQLLDIHTLPLPADAPISPDWRLQVGLYDSSSLVRLPARDSFGRPLPDDAVTLELADWLRP